MTRLIQLDQRLFLYLNGLGSSKFDAFWLGITHPLWWTPLFLLMLYLVFKKYKSRGFWFLFFLLVLSVTATWGTSEIVKTIVRRMRPCQDPEMITQMRRLTCAKYYSFFSGHAGTSFCIATFLSMVLQKKWWIVLIVFAWAALFSYSRIYIGVHYPGDILVGMIVGILLGRLGAGNTLKYLSQKYPALKGTQD